MELQAFELRVLQLHHRQTVPPLQLTTLPNIRLEFSCSISIYQLHTFAMAALYTGAPPQGGPGYSFKQTPTTVPSGERQHGFYPYVLPGMAQTIQLTVYRYTDNGGSTLGISGADFTILAGDTRSTSGYNINTRYAPKLFKIGGEGPENKGARIVLSVVGFAADGDALKERLDTIVKMYKYQHGKPMSVSACAQRLSHILYNKRFFPYYVHAILGGLDEEGKGALYSYDPVGSYEREQCRAAGAAASLIMPFLDNQVNFKNMYEPGSGTGHELKSKQAQPLPRDHVEDLVRDAFTSAVERHIEVGDGLQMMIITKEGIAETFTPLKRD